MASNNMQYAAILSRNELTSQDSNDLAPKPTIFDIIAQENMNSLFRLSFNHLVEWASKYSSRITRFKKYKNELYLILHSTLEYFYLRAYDALLSENFYGMRRINLGSGNRKRILSILLSIVVPYLKAKLDDVYEELERAVDEGTEYLSQNSYLNSIFSQRIMIKMKALMLKYYPYFHLIWSTIFWYFRFVFMMGKSHFNSPLLRLINLRLVYNMNSLKSNDSLGEKLMNGLNYGFTSLLFFMQFLQWYNSYNEQASYSSDMMHPLNGFISMLKSSTKSNDNASSSQTIRPPKLSDKLTNSNIFKQMADKNLCPICSNKRRNESVLTVSGLVFCYICIFKFVKEHKRCPLTGYPCDVKNIIRIYSSADS